MDSLIIEDYESDEKLDSFIFAVRSHFAKEGVAVRVFKFRDDSGKRLAIELAERMHYSTGDFGVIVFDKFDTLAREVRKKQCQ